MSEKLQVKFIHLADRSYFVILKDGKNITADHTRAIITFDKSGKITSIKLT